MRALISQKWSFDLICNRGVNISYFCFVLNADITRTYLEQETTGRKKSTLPDEQRTVNSKGSIHQKPYELINKATYEDTKPSEQRSRSFEVISLDPGDETAYCTTEKSKWVLAVLDLESKNWENSFFLLSFSVSPFLLCNVG